MRVRWLLFVAVVPLLVGAEGASDESQFRCEEAAARVIACCPHVAAPDLYCSQATRGCWDEGCKDGPVLGPTFSTCIRDATCDVIRDSGGCDYFHSLRGLSSCDRSPDPPEGLCH